MEFDNDDDIHYYLHDDPIHLAFANSLDEHVESVQALDFEPGLFGDMKP